jgi:hypothetical protein
MPLSGHGLATLCRRNRTAQGSESPACPLSAESEVCKSFSCSSSWSSSKHRAFVLRKKLTLPQLFCALVRLTLDSGFVEDDLLILT